ncbi:plasmid replication initiator protein [Streptomyces sp. PTM05]|uniref:Plasmid replication initiator protein n=1 Tax=Streptantibioticus parmotrematis TaxID=2873249 RepID=A0ABS7QUN5_9ACTN|nr:replication initiator [Streptantibioticus parmotrematis]MBY8886902.1 plasmid replication initiator protein [Streptantibioticus parmotrematis]
MPGTPAPARRSGLPSPLTIADMVRVAERPDFRRWLTQMEAVGGCTHPIYLAGRSVTFDRATGAVLHAYSTRDEPGERLAVRCGNRRTAVCPTCARLHSGDTYHLVRAGLAGGKGITSAVATHPRLFVTLTAPSFGRVHRAGGCHPYRSGTCDHGRPLGCGLEHEPTDPACGQPVCPDCYDYAGHALWHAAAGRLWNRWCDRVRRGLARAAGVPVSRFPEAARLSFAKVAEYQRRAAVHHHVVVRLDGPQGPADTPPAWATTDVLTQAVEDATRAASVPLPYSPAVGDRTVRFGPQMDAHPIRTGIEDGAVTDDAVAAYIAKYTSKSAGASGGADHRITTPGQIAAAAVTPHVRALMRACWRLGGLPEFAGLRLRAWIHTLGYRGHILTKSRAYSTTYGALRAERAEHRKGSLAGDKAQVTAAEWRFVGSGLTLGEQWFARSIRESRQNNRESATAARNLSENSYDP